MELQKIIDEDVGKVNHIQRRIELIDKRIQGHKETIERYRDKIEIENDKIDDLKEQKRRLTG